MYEYICEKENRGNEHIYFFAFVPSFYFSRIYIHVKSTFSKFFLENVLCICVFATVCKKSRYYILEVKTKKKLDEGRN